MVDADFSRPPRPVLAFVCAAALAWTAAASAGTAGADGTQSAALARIALLVDTSDGTSASITQMRAGLQSFVDALPPEPELLVATTGRRTAVRVQPTTDRQRARNSLGGLISDNGPTPLMDAILEIDDRFMRKARDRRPIFVIVTGDGSESSRTNPDTFNQWLATLHGRSGVAHALIIKSGNGMPEIVARAAVQATSGLLQTISPGARIADAMRKIALRISDPASR